MSALAAKIATARKAPGGLSRPAMRKRRADPVALLIGLAMVLAVGLFAASQHVARQFGFDPRLSGTRWSLPAELDLVGTVLSLALAAGALVVAGRAVSKRAWGRLRLAGALGFAAALVYVAWGPHLYAPHAIVGWVLDYGASPAFAPALTQGLWVFGGVLAFGSVGLVVVLRGGGEVPLSETFGSADFGDATWFAEAPKGKLRHGIPVGYREGEETLLFDDSGTHAFICAPTGAGKTVGFAIPTLLAHHGSAFILDIKGELQAVTARHRRETLGQQVRTIDPFGGESDAFNPLDTVITRYDLGEGATPDDVAEHAFAFDNAKMISEMLVVKSGQEREPFFTDNARQFLTGLILYVACTERRTREVRVPDFEAYHRLRAEHEAGGTGKKLPDYLALYELAELVRQQNPGGAAGDGEVPWFPGMPYRAVHKPNEKRSLVEVRRLLMLPDVELRELLAAMAGHEHEVVRKRGAQFMRMDERTFSSVVATVRSHTEFLDSPSIQKTLRRSTFDFRELKTSACTVFLIMPVERLDNYSRFVRVLIGCAQVRLLALKFKPRYPILFLLDEFPRLQRFEKIDEGLSAHRGFGIQYLIIVQSVAQLEDVYDKLWRNFITNTTLQVLWAPNDDQACKFISDAAGDYTAVYVETSRNTGQQGRYVLADSFSSGNSETTRETRRKLIEPDEARTLDHRYCFVLSRGRGIVVLRRPNYLTDPAFRGAFDPNPYHDSDERTVVVNAAGRAFVAATKRVYRDPQAARRAFLRRCVEVGVEAARREMAARPERFGALLGHALVDRAARQRAQTLAADVAEHAAGYYRAEGGARVRDLLGLKGGRGALAAAEAAFAAASEALYAYPEAARLQFAERCRAAGPAAAAEALRADPTWAGPLRLDLADALRPERVRQFADAGRRYVEVGGLDLALAA